ncbi:hypothetical protein [uncultured Methylobacterium sp.]|uniref:hypothetical protein n=1 Tax=uncultured Methylobacterium sp. TaxID=157278 RepID=UPI0011571897|nr:hypothetical protein [uncultured Methylobacterium sp.]
MAARRTDTGERWRGARAVIAVLALYALVLQAFLGGLMPLAGPGDIHCAPAEAAGQAPGAASHDKASHDHAACCVAAQAAATALPGREPAVTSARPRPAAAPVAWAATADFNPRAPPGALPHPRGPPVA